MRAFAASVLLLTAVGCASPVPPTFSPGASNTPSPVPAVTPSTIATPGATPTLQMGPTASPAGLRVGALAKVTVDQLQQVADPTRPRDGAFQSPRSALARALSPLTSGQDVYLLEGPRTIDGRDWWRIADSAFVGCCAPFGWIPATTAQGAPAIQADQPICSPGSKVTAENIKGAGDFGWPACLSGADVALHGTLVCSRPIIDAPYFLSGFSSWYDSGYECQVDSALNVYGSTLIDLIKTRGSSDGWQGSADLTGHFYEPTSDGCRWAEGDLYQIPVDNAPIDTAQFACQMRFFVTTVTPLP
jgi:hypothetical protein